MVASLTNEKKELYKKIYAEAYEVIGYFEDEVKQKIPHELLEYLEKYRDKNHTFKYDINKPLEEQDILIETKGFLISLFNKYLSNSFEQEILNKFQRCVNNKVKEIELQEVNESKINTISNTDEIDENNNYINDINSNNTQEINKNLEESNINDNSNLQMTTTNPLKTKILNFVEKIKNLFGRKK